MADDREAARTPRDARLRLRPLKGWWLVDDAADYLGISRQAVHRQIERGTIRKARTLGASPGRRPVIVVWEEEIRALPMSPQRKREFRLRGDLDEAAPDGPEPELGDELPGG